MRKRSRYRPKPQLPNPLAYVLESLKPVTQHDTYLLDLKLKNHAALVALTQGRATRQDIDFLISMANMCEALYRMGFGTDYEGVVKAGMDALWEVGKRGADTDRFILKAAEMSALNTLMELHDAQMEVVVVKDIENAIKVVHNEFRAKKMRPIVKKVMSDADTESTT